MSEISERYPNDFDFKKWTLRGKILTIMAVISFILLTVVAPLFFNKPHSVGGIPALWVFTNAVGWTWLFLAWIVGFGLKR